MKIKIKTLVECQIYIVMIVEMLISLFHIPTVTRYLLDVNMLLLIVVTVSKNNKTQNITKEYIFLRRYIFIYMYVFIAGAVLMSVPIGQILWAFRNNYFYILYFFICILYLNKREADRLMKRLMNLQILNVLAAIYELYFLGAKNDYLGGIFGTTQGCNGYLNVYCVIICAYVLTKYMNKKASFWMTLWIVGSSLLLAGVSELKFFYAELIVIIVFVVLLNANLIKGIAVIAIGFFGLLIGLNILSVVNEDSIKYLNSFDALIEYGSRSDFGDDEVRIARVTAIQQVDELFFEDNVWNKLFGYGFGACEESSTFSVCNSDFADEYGFLGYRNLTSSMNYLETGMIGFIMFILIFVFIFIIIQKTKKDLFEDSYIGTFVQVVTVLTILICFYNSAIRREIAYITFFVFAYYFINLKAKKNGGY